MRVSGLALQYFRLHKSFSLQFEEQISLIIGSNASGKTSILEALVLLATGKSFRADKIAEMVSFGQEIARVKGVVVPEALPEVGESESSMDVEKTELEVILTRGIVNGQRSAYRLFSVNGVKRQQRKATGILKTVLFRPEDMRLVEGSPSRRRNYFDSPLSLLYEDYENSLKVYDQVLKRRNKLILAVRDNQQPRSVLEYWNQALIKHGEIIQEYRRRFVSTAPGVDFPIQLQFEYNPSIISQDRIKQYLEKEIAAGHTLVGPHKDDFIVTFVHPSSAEPLDIALYGSRGQQRLAVLWLKLVELYYLQKESGERPVLLLDDIFSELDATSQNLVLELLKVGQTVITTTDTALEQVLEAKFSGRMQTLHLQSMVLS